MPLSGPGTGSEIRPDNELNSRFGVTIRLIWAAFRAKLAAVAKFLPSRWLARRRSSTQASAADLLTRLCSQGMSRGHILIADLSF